jgi:hypothetical protein
MQAWSSKYSLEQRLHPRLISWHASRPVPYDCVVNPRFPEVESILAEERERFGI